MLHAVRRLGCAAIGVLASLAVSHGVTSAEPLGLPADLSNDTEAQGFADLLFANGMAALAGRDYRAAQPLFENAAATWPKDATYAYFAAICRLKMAALAAARPGSAGGGKAGLAADAGLAAEALRRLLPPAPVRVSESRRRYDLGEALYLAGDPPGAEKEFRASIALDDRDGWAHFYLGLTLVSLGNSDEALEEFERAKGREAAVAANSSFDRGVAALKGGDTKEARKRFESVLAVARTPGFGDLTEKTRPEAISSRNPTAGAPPHFEIRVGGGYEHDDNPLQLTEAFRLAGASFESDTRRVGQLRAAWNPITDMGGWTGGLVLNGYASRHETFSQADLEGGQAIVQAVWGADPLGYVNGPLGYARTQAGNDRLGVLIQAGVSYFDRDSESFRRDQEVAASFYLRETGFGSSQLELHYDDVTYFHDLLFEQLDGHSASARLGQYLYLGNRPDRYLRVAVAGTRTTTQTEFLDQRSVEGLLELALPLWKRWTVFLAGARAHEHYDDGALFEKAHRTDLSASVIYTNTKHSYLTVRYGRTDRDVTPDASSYDRHLVSGSITFHW